MEYPEITKSGIPKKWLTRLLFKFGTRHSAIVRRQPSISTAVLTVPPYMTQLGLYVAWHLKTIILRQSRSSSSKCVRFIVSIKMPVNRILGWRRVCVIWAYLLRGMKLRAGLVCLVDPTRRPRSWSIYVSIHGALYSVTSNGLLSDSLQNIWAGQTSKKMEYQVGIVVTFIAFQKDLVATTQTQG